MLLVSFLLVSVKSVNALLRPLVVWHGMGDNAANLATSPLFKDLPSDLFIHFISVSSPRSLQKNTDMMSGFIGSINSQVEDICNELAAIPELKDGFNALGFSQGGLFLRAYVQRCNSPHVNNLITFGSAHGGVSSLPAHCDEMTFLIQRSLCRFFTRTLALNLMYSLTAQTNSIQVLINLI